MDDDEINASKTQALFEFTKRKRWADTLISELVNVAILVFSQTGTIIHCDAAVNAVTGYPEEQIAGRNFAELLHRMSSLRSSRLLLLTSHPKTRSRRYP
jgi:PAS domain S-box-containing protein